MDDDAGQMTDGAVTTGTCHAARRRLVVMESVPALRSTTNPYLHQLVDALAPFATVELFTWRRALAGRYDVFHVHWPELLSRGTSVPKTWAKRALTWLLQTRIARTRTALVRTAHNLEPHEGGSAAERYLLRRWDRLTTAWVVLNEATPLPDAALTRLIPHGHYADHYAAHRPAAPIAGRIGFVGQVRPYKGVEALLRAFAELDDPRSSLVIAGAVRTEALREELEGIARTDDRIIVEAGYVTDARLVEVVTSSSLVALPYVSMHNSGALLLALSLRRPVLAPRNVVTDALAKEVGEAWLRLYDGTLSRDVLAAASQAGVPDGSPDLSRRDWADAGRAHVALFEEAVEQSNGLRRRTPR